MLIQSYEQEVSIINIYIKIYYIYIYIYVNITKFNYIPYKVKKCFNLFIKNMIVN